MPFSLQDSETFQNYKLVTPPSNSSSKHSKHLCLAVCTPLIFYSCLSPLAQLRNTCDPSRTSLWQRTRNIRLNKEMPPLQTPVLTHYRLRIYWLYILFSQNHGLNTRGRARRLLYMMLSPIHGSNTRGRARRWCNSKHWLLYTPLP